MMTSDCSSWPHVVLDVFQYVIKREPESKACLSEHRTLQSKWDMSWTQWIVLTNTIGCYVDSSGHWICHWLHLSVCLSVCMKWYVSVHLWPVWEWHFLIDCSVRFGENLTNYSSYTSLVFQQPRSNNAVSLITLTLTSSWWSLMRWELGQCWSSCLRPRSRADKTVNKLSPSVTSLLVSGLRLPRDQCDC